MVRKHAKADVTPMRQRSQYTCMAASMAMCLQALGFDTNEDEVNRVMGAAPMKGAAWEQALASAQHYGCRATLTVPATLKQVKAWTDAGTPVMIAWNPEGREWSHASLIFDVVEDKEHGYLVHVADPNIPDPDETVRIVTKKDFYSKWYERWPSYLVRRVACAIEREIDPKGRPVMASSPLRNPMNESDKMSRDKDKTTMKGPAPAKPDALVKDMLTRGWGAGSHHNRERDVAKGRSRKPKHPGREHEAATLTVAYFGEE